jgi:hypothetical protein
MANVTFIRTVVHRFVKFLKKKRPEMAAGD